MFKKLKLKIKNTYKTIKSFYQLMNKLSEIPRQLDSMQQTVNQININTTPVFTFKKIKIGFLIHNVDAWYSIESIVNNTIADSSFEVYIFSINKKFPGQVKYCGEEVVHNFLQNLGIGHIRLNMQDSYSGLNILKAIGLNVIFRQSQWDNDFQPGFSSLNLSFARLTYISYELINHTINVPLNDDIIDSATDSSFHRLCWRVYCTNQLVKNQAIKNGKINGVNFKVVGHPKIDFHINNKSNYWPIKSIRKKTSRILWTAHHSILTGWNDFGMFNIVYMDMLKWASCSNNIEIVLSPHPALLTLLNSENSPIGQKDFQNFLKRWENLPNCFFYTSHDYPSLINACDFVITDSPSISIEAQFYSKTLIFLDRSDRIEFNEIGKIIENGFHKAKNFDDAVSFVDYFQKNIDPKIEVQKRNIEELFSYRNASTSIIKDIKDELLNNL